MRYGADCCAVAWTPAEVKSKRMSHALGIPWPAASAPENCHWRAAFWARPAKYLLGPGELRSELITFPAASSWTFTTTWKGPWMVGSAFCGGFGRTSFRTSPRPTTAPAVFARGAGDGAVYKTADDGVSEEASTGR